MKKPAELKQERAEKVEAQSKLVQEVKRSEKDFTEEQEKRFNDLNDEIEALDKAIERAEKVDAAEKRAASIAGTPVQTEDKEERKVKEAASITKAIRMVSLGKKLEGAEKEMSELAIEENKRAGVETPDNALLHIPMSMLRATAQTVTEDSGLYGGKLVNDAAPRLQMPFAPKTFLEELGVTRWGGLTGGSIPLPVGNKYGFNWLTETQNITPQKQQFDGPTLSPQRLGGAVEISNRLLLQSSVNVENYIRQQLFAGYDRAVTSAVINGSGVAPEPEGVLNKAGIQLAAATVAAAPTRADLIELKKLIKTADASRQNLAFLMSPDLEAAFQNTKVDAGSGIFLMNEDGSIAGYKAVSSTLVPELAGNSVLIFGDWSKVFLGEWGSMSVLSDPYSASLANSIRLVVNGHAGVAIAQPEAFAVNKFLTA